MAGRNHLGIEQPAREDARYWRTNTCHCDADEETTWWGFWYPWLIQGRSAHLFEAGDSLTQILIFWSAIVSILFAAAVMVLYDPLTGLVIGSISMLIVIWKRASIRKTIRRKLNIHGSFVNDLFLHCCCSMCTICQEAREGKLIHGSPIDLCTGEPLHEQTKAYDRNTGQGRRGTFDSPADGDYFMNHLRSISRTSKLLLRFSLGLMITLFIKMLIVGETVNILIPLLAFVQPCIILYFLYWRARRQQTSLDLVIKCFAVGFFVTTHQSIILEMLSQLILLMPVILLLPSILPPPVLPTIGARNTLSAALSGLFAMHNSLFSSPGGPSFGLSPSPGISLLARYHQMRQHVHSIHLAADGSVFGGGDAISGDWTEEILRQAMQKHLSIVLFALVIASFVTAAGVEETMKHFIVRCCPFTSPLQDPQSIVVYLVSGALGFATYENIQYSFAYPAMEGRLTTLLIRSCLPVHIICAVLQAINLSKVVTGKKDMSLIRIMLPAILVHGTFDFTLFALAAISFTYNITDTTVATCTYVFNVTLTIASAIYAYRGIKEEERNYDIGYGLQVSDESNVIF